MKRHDYYILVGQSAVPEPDLLKWAEWMGMADRIVKQTEIPGGLVSTVFLGLDHAFLDGPPLLFETMIFRDGKPCQCWRCSTWLEAEMQHEGALTVSTKEREK